MRKKESVAAPFSHAEFDALPDSVQRKYFSTLERLRIAEQQSLAEHQLDCSRRSSRSHHRPALRQPSIALHHSLTLGSSRRRLRKAESLRQEHEICQQDAQFFLSLPEKLRKQHFSREEQVLLVGRCDQPSVPSLPFHQPEAQHPRQRLDEFNFNFFDEDVSDSSHARRGRIRRRSRSVSPSRISFGTDEQEVDSYADESLIHLDIMSSSSSHRNRSSQVSSFRRTLSLTNLPNLPIRLSTSSAPPPALDPPFLPLSHQVRHQRSTSLSQTGRRSSHAPNAPVFDPEATHYQDPEARKKLRMFLASPQKFDEAVEFGFPSTSGNDTVRPSYELPPITTDARNFSRDMQTFLRDDKMSFLEDDEHEDVDAKSDSGESMTDLESPVTPSSIGLSFRCHTHGSPSQFSSLDSAGLPPMQPMHGRLNREMTLRMTLTRPDLRADEDQLYGWQGQKGGKDDPFALEELHLSDDMTGAKGAFAVKPKPHGNLVSRIFKRASKKGR